MTWGLYYAFIFCSFGINLSDPMMEEAPCMTDSVSKPFWALTVLAG